MGVSMPELLLTIHLVRHGETVANRKGIIQGQEDSELTPLGIDQAVATATRLRGNKYWQVYASDLVRAFRTAEIILEEHEGPVPKKSELLREFRLGVQEGLPRGTTRSEACRIKAEKEGVPLTDYVAPRRETVSEVRKRSRVFLKRLIAEATRDAPGRGKEATLALVVAHGGLLNVMMVGVMGLGEEVGFMTNCGVTIVDVFEKGDGEGRVLYRARTVNDDKHLVQTGLKTGSQVETFVRRKKEPIVAERRSAGGIET